MKTTKYSESQIVQILKEYESGIAAPELARKYGFNRQTLYDWKKKYGGINSSQELRRLKELEAENHKLKRMYAEVSLQRDALKDLIEKKL
jgi:putative transposase